MRESDKYSDKYKYNEEFVDFLKSSGKYPDWTIIGIFYSALHYMNLFLCTQYGIDIETINSHSKRNSIIDKNCSEKISKKYNQLYNMSRTARYQYINMTNQLNYAYSCYKLLKDFCAQEILSNNKQ